MTTRTLPKFRRLALGLAPSLALLACGETASDGTAAPTDATAAPTDAGPGTDAAAFEGARLLPDAPDAGAVPPPESPRVFEGCRGVEIVAGTTLDVTLPTPAHLTFSVTHGGRPIRAQSFRFVPRTRDAAESWPQPAATAEAPFRYSVVPGRYDVWAAGACGVEKSAGSPELPCGDHLIGRDVEIVGDVEQTFEVDLRHVRGTLTVNGRPAKGGSVIYAVSNETAPPAAGQVDYAAVVDGAFDLLVAPGRGHLDFVDLRSPKDDGDPPVGPVELLAEVDSTAADVTVTRDLPAVTTRVEVPLAQVGVLPGRALVGWLYREGDPTDWSWVAVESAPPLAVATVVAIPGRYTLRIFEDPAERQPPEAPAAQTIAPPSLVIEAGETIKIDVTPVTLRGRLEAPSPTAEVTAPLHVAFSALGAPVEVVADPDGQFEAALLPGTYTVTAYREPAAAGAERVEYVGPAFEINADATLDLPLEVPEATSLESYFARVEFTFDTSGASLPHGVEPYVIDLTTGEPVESGALVEPDTGFLWGVDNISAPTLGDTGGAPITPAAIVPALTPGETTSITLSAKWVNLTGTLQRDPTVPVESMPSVALDALTPGMAAGGSDYAGPNGHVAMIVAEGPHVVTIRASGLCDLTAFDPVPCNAALVGCED